MNDRIDAVLVDTSVYHKKQCDFEGITNSIIPMLLQLLRAMEGGNAFRIVIDNILNATCGFMENLL